MTVTVLRQNAISVDSGGSSTTVANGTGYGYVDIVVPTNGQTVTIRTDKQNGTTVIDPASTLTSLVIAFPTDAQSEIGQFVRIAYMKEIATITFLNASIMGDDEMSLGNELDVYQKVKPSIWMKV